MNITLIAAIGKNGELGKNNDLIWHLKKDMKFFKDNTMGKAMIMGRNTLESLPNILPGRKHLVLTHQNIEIPGVEIFNNKEDLLNYIDNLDEVMVIGGEAIYNQFIEYANKLLLTEIDCECSDADKFFPKITKNNWNEKILLEDNEKNIKFKHKEYIRLHK